MGNFRQRVTDIHLLTVSVRVGFAEIRYLLPSPHSAFGSNHQRIVAGIIALDLGEQARQQIEIERIFGNQAARGSHVSGVERREARIAAKDSEDADALVRAERCPLPGYQLL